MAIVSIAHHSIVHIKAQPNLHNPGVRVGMAKLLISHVLADSRAHLLACQVADARATNTMLSAHLKATMF